MRLAHAGPEHLDPSFVAGYDRKQGHPDPALDLAALSRLGMDRTWKLLDLGAGTGQLALAAAAAVRRVMAADVSTPMLDRLSARAVQAGLSNVVCVRAGFLSYHDEGARD